MVSDKLRNRDFDFAACFINFNFTFFIFCIVSVFRKKLYRLGLYIHIIRLR